MVPANTDSSPPTALSWRAEAAWLRDQLAAGGGPDDAAHEERLRRIDEALAEPEPSRGRPFDSNAALAVQTIEAMKGGEEVSAEGVRAVVALAEHAIEDVRSFEIRWEADMRAIKRWQASDAMPASVRSLLTRAAERFREYEAHHSGEVTTIFALGDCTDPAADVAAAKAERNGDMAGEIEALLAEAAPGARSLIWPDHADLVVWLIDQLERDPPWPPVSTVEQVQARLAVAVLKSGGNQLAKDARRLIAHLAETLRHACRQHFASEQMRAQLGRQLAQTHNVLRQAKEEIAGAAMHYADDSSGMGQAYREAKAVERLIDGLLELHAQPQREPLIPVPLAMAGAVEFEPQYHEPPPEDDGCPKGDPECLGSNDGCHDQCESFAERQARLEAKINETLASRSVEFSPGLAGYDLASLVYEIAPGWEFAQVPQSDPPQIKLTRYAPKEPI